MKYTFTVEIETDNIISAKEQIAALLEDIGNVSFTNVKRHLPKKPLEKIYPWCVCPTCGGSVYCKHIKEYIQSGETTHCEHCGQVLDWSEE